MNIVEKAFRDGVEALNCYLPPGTEFSSNAIQEISDSDWDEWKEENKAEFQSASNTLLSAIIEYLATDGSYSIYDASENMKAREKIINIIGIKEIKKKQKIYRSR